MLKMVDGTGIIGVDMICPLGVSAPQPPNYDRVELEGAGMLVLPNSLDAPLERLELGGKTEQVQTSGKNLFDTSFAKNKENYKEVTIAGSVIYAIELSLKPNTKYAFQCVIKSVPTTMNVGNSTIRYVVSDGQKRVITTNEDGKLYIGFSGNPDGEIHKIGVSIVDIQVEESTTVTPYEPYTGGKPSPSPEYPQEIKNVGKRNEDKQKYEVNVKVIGKNLFNREKAKDVSNWISIEGDGYLKFPIRAKKGSMITFSYEEKLTEGKKFYLGIAKKETGTVIAWLYHDANSSISNSKYTIAAEEDYVYLMCNRSAIQTFLDVIKTLQVEISQTQTEYEPYKEQTLTITSDRPITKWNRLVEQGGEIGWLYGSYVGKMPKTGYSISYKNDGKNYYFRQVLTTPICDFAKQHFNCFKNGDASSENGIDVANIKVDRNRLQIALADTSVDSIQEFESYLQNLGELEFLYRTSETEFIPLPQSEQNTIRALKTYYPTTVITVDGGELDPDIKVTYRKEI